MACDSSHITNDIKSTGSAAQNLRVCMFSVTGILAYSRWFLFISAVDMAKDPAFLFYPGDWLGGTMHMQRISRACYFDLLMLQFNRGAFSFDEMQDCLGKDADKWDKIKDKFVCENSMYYNKRMREEIDKRRAFTNSRKAGAYAMHKHMLMENENENRNEDRIKDGIGNAIPEPPNNNEPEIPEEKFNPPEHLKKIWPHFEKHRRILKKPMTDFGRKILVSKLNRLSTDPASQVKMLEQSIENGWQGVFELSAQKKTAEDYLREQGIDPCN